MDNKHNDGRGYPWGIHECWRDMQYMYSCTQMYILGGLPMGYFYTRMSILWGYPWVILRGGTRGVLTNVYLRRDMHDRYSCTRRYILGGVPMGNSYTRMYNLGGVSMGNSYTLMYMDRIL